MGSQKFFDLSEDDTFFDAFEAGKFFAVISKN
jgi:hypothetical protein